MSIEVDFTNPAPWVVVVHPLRADDPGDVTWPFQDEEAAQRAYAMAVKSGQFTATLRKATKKRPAVVVTYVSLWRLEWDEPREPREPRPSFLDPIPNFHYVGAPPWCPVAATEVSA